MPKLTLSMRRDKRVKQVHKDFYDRQLEIIIKLDDQVLFRGHKDDSVVKGIIRANPNCTVEWVDKSRTDDVMSQLRGIK